MGLLTLALCAASAVAQGGNERVALCALPVPATPPDPTRCARMLDQMRDEMREEIRHDQAMPADGDRIDAWIAYARRESARARHDRAEDALDCAVAASPALPDAALKRRLLRARGGLDYNRDRIPEALERLQCALAISSAGDDREAEAADLNALGSALRRLGDYRGALAALTESLEMRRAAGGDTGAVLNNIADVYRELGERDDAMRHYREALAAFREAGDAAHAAHVLESMAVVLLEDGDPVQARSWLEEALTNYRAERRRDFELRVHGWLVRASLAEGDLDAARRWSASGQALALEHSLAPPASFTLQAARTERLSGAARSAVARLRGVLASGADAPPAISGDERAELYAELAAAQEASGDTSGAIASLRRAREQAEAFSRATHDRQLGWLRARFETAERDRTIARLESDNRTRRLQLALSLALAAAAMLGGWLWLQRRRVREREAEAARLARKEEELARYRREAGALAEDRELLQSLLDSREEALCLLDAEGQVLAANRVACERLGAEASGLVGHSFAEGLEPGQRAALLAAVEHMEDTPGQMLVLDGADGRAIEARLSQWAQGEGLLLLELRPQELRPQEPSTQAPAAARTSSHPPAELAPPVAAVHAEGVSADGIPADGMRADGMQLDGMQLDGMPVKGMSAEGTSSDAMPADAMRDAFRRTLVELMLAATDAWERSTGETRLELAEKSRIWRVAIDDGRLRARSMERYLSLARLPQNPRWRDVLRTAYHVLENCVLDPTVRADLQARVDAVLAFTRRSALV